MQANTRDGNISVSIRKSAKRGHCTRAEQECCIMTDSSPRLKKKNDLHGIRKKTIKFTVQFKREKLNVLVAVNITCARP